MAVPEQTPYIEHTGNGATTSFSLGFQCESKDHLIVLVDEIEPPIETWSLSGGNVVFTTAPAAGKQITLQRNTPFSRTANYQSFNNSFRPQTVNVDFDRIWWKLQELGVANWLMKQYVDKKDDELKAYLMEEIRKQGVALDQLDDYYNYLMQRLAQIAVDKGWDASFVVDGDKNQHQINEEQKAQNNNFKSKIRKTPYDFGAKGGDNDDTAAVKACIESGYFLINDAHKVQPLHILNTKVDGEFTQTGKLIFTHTDSDSIIWENCKGIVRNPVIEDAQAVGGSYRTWTTYKSKGFSAYRLKVIGGKTVPVAIDDSDYCFIIDSEQDNTGLWRPFAWQIVYSRFCKFIRCNLTYFQFGIVIIGLGYKSGSRPQPTRPFYDCVGMSAVDCIVTNATDNCFDINGAVGASFVRCIADQQYAALNYSGFQIKQSTNIPEELSTDTYVNQLIDCTSINCSSGFNLQAGHFSKITNFTAINTSGGVVSLNGSPRVEIDGLFVYDFGLDPVAAGVVGGVANVLRSRNNSSSVIVRNVVVTMTNDTVDGSKISFIDNESNSLAIDGFQVNFLSTTPTHLRFLRNTGAYLRLCGSIRIGGVSRYTTLIDDTAINTVYPTVISKVIDLEGPTENIYFDQMQNNGMVIGKVSTTALDLSGSDAQISVGISGNVAGLRALDTISTGTNVTDPNTIKNTTGNTPIVCRRQAGTTGSGKVLVQVRGFDLL